MYKHVFNFINIDKEIFVCIYGSSEHVENRRTVQRKKNILYSDQKPIINIFYLFWFRAQPLSQVR